MKLNRHTVASVIFFSFLFSLYSSFLSAVGFGAGTLVHTRRGTVPIEQLKVGEEVWGYNLEKNQYVETKICGRKIGIVPSVLVFTTKDGETFTVEKNQTFYAPEYGQWLTPTAIDEKRTSLFRSIVQDVEIASITEKNEDTFTYDISLDEPHTFLVGKNPILAHNFIEAAIGIKFGAGAVTFFWKAFVGLWGIGIGYVAHQAGNEKRGNIEIRNEGAFENVVTRAFGSRSSDEVYATPTEAQQPKEKESVSTGGEEDSCDSGNDTDKKTGGKEELLPKEGSHVFEPKKHKGKELLRDKKGRYIDKKGNKWQWDPIKKEWDVQHHDGKYHSNVTPDGKISHKRSNFGRKK